MLLPISLLFLASGTPFSGETYVKASDTEAGDELGGAVAISGDTAVVGAPGATGDEGAVYVYVRTGSSWSEEAVLVSNASRGDRFGHSVAISGDTIVAGAPLEDSSATGVDGAEADDSVSNSGAAYVFVRAGTTWSRQAYLKASNTGAQDRFGSSVAISGDTVVVGAHHESSAATGIDGDGADDSLVSSGAAYVFTRAGTTWSQQAYVKAADPDAIDMFGAAVAVDGDLAIVGAVGEDGGSAGVGGDESDDSVQQSGAAYVFERVGTTWSQKAYVKASHPEFQDAFGGAVSIDGDTTVVGAVGEDGGSTGVGGDPADNSASRAGAAYVFRRTAGVWAQEAYLKSSNTAANDLFGGAACVRGDDLIVGADNESLTAFQGGAAYAFRRVGSSWTPLVHLTASNAGAFDLYGSAVALDGDTALVGAWSENSIATGIDGDASDDSASNAGAAYVYEPSAATTYCTAGTTANGCAAAISASGTPSVSASSGFTIDVTGAEGQRSGLVFYGISGRAALAWGMGAMASSSFLCVKSPTQRTPAGVTTGTAGACDGTFGVDWSAYVAANPSALGAPFASGATVNAQFWFRDPPSPNTTHLSDGLEFVTCP